MLILRPTQKLAKRLRYTLTPTDQSSTTRLGDWYGNIYQIGRTQLILCVSERSRLPVIVPAKDGKNFPNRLNDILRALLQSIVPDAQLIDTEMVEMQEVIYAKSVNRSVLGTMNDYGHALNFYDLNPPSPTGYYDLSLLLAEVPSGALNYQNPIAVTRSLFAANPSVDRSPLQ